MANEAHGQVGPRVPERDLGRENPDIQGSVGPRLPASDVGRVIHPDDAVARIAARQRGVITLRQLLDAGLTRAGVDWRLSVGRLHRLFRGVYLVGHSVAPPLARELGATLACGAGSALSHRSGIHLWKLLPRMDAPELIDVSIVGRRGLAIPGITIHRPRQIDRRDLTRLHDLPVTTAARTLLDFAEQAEERELQRAFSEAQARRLITPSSVRWVLERGTGRRGAKPLAELLARAATTRSDSDLEELLLSLIRAANLPEPEMQVLLLGRYRVDFFFRDHDTIAETDGGGWHLSQQRRDNDNRRDSALRAAGYKVERFTDHELTYAPHAALTRLTRAIYAVKP
jgi:very-short-patch-repair endonuclease